MGCWGDACALSLHLCPDVALPPSGVNFGSEPVNSELSPIGNHSSSNNSSSARPGASPAPAGPPGPTRPPAQLTGAPPRRSLHGSIPMLGVMLGVPHSSAQLHCPEASPTLHRPQLCPPVRAKSAPPHSPCSHCPATPCLPRATTKERTQCQGGLLCLAPS